MKKCFNLKSPNNKIKIACPKSNDLSVKFKCSSQVFVSSIPALPSSPRPHFKRNSIVGDRAYKTNADAKTRFKIESEEQDKNPFQIAEFMQTINISPKVTSRLEVPNSPPMRKALALKTPMKSARSKEQINRLTKRLDAYNSKKYSPK